MADARRGVRTVLIPCSEWGSSKGGLSTMNRMLAISLAKNEALRVYLYIPQGNCSLADKQQAQEANITILDAKPITGQDDNLVWLYIPPDELPKPDIIIGHGRKFGSAAHCICRLSPGTKWVQFVHVSCEDLGAFKDNEGSLSENEKKHWVEVKLCEEAHVVVGVGEQLSGTYENGLAFEDKTVETIHPGIFDDLANVRKKKQDGKPWQVFVFGRGTAEDFKLKGFDIAAKAIAIRGEDYKLTMVGAPKEKENEVQKRMVESGRIDDRKFLREGSQLVVRGYCDRQEFKKMLSEADLVIMPSRTEGFGLIGLEAISAGVPVLVSNYSGLAGAMRKVAGGGACIVRSDDPEDWAQSIKGVLKDTGRETRLEAAQQLKENYAKKYPWEAEGQRLAKMLLSLYETEE